MKQTLLIILLLATGIANAQYYNENSFYQQKVHKSNPAYKKVETITLTTYNRNNKVTEKEVQYYLPSLKRYKTETYNKKGVLKNTSGTTYFNDSLMDSWYYTKKEDTIRLTKYSYNNNLQLEKRSFTYKKKTAITYFTYNSKNKVATSTEIGSNGKEGYKYEYDYFENGSRKETKYYRKGKLKYTWNYECSETGELEAKNKAKVCSKLTHNTDGTFTEIDETTERNNKVYRNITVYNADTLILSNERLNPKGKQINKYVYLRDKKSDNVYETNYYRGGKLKLVFKNTYNNMALLIKSEKYNSKNQLRNYTLRDYTFYK